MIGIFVAALAGGSGYRILYRHGTSEQVVSIAAVTAPVHFKKRRTTSKNVGCGALDEPYSNNTQGEKDKHPDLSFFHGKSPWKSLVRRTRYFANSYHKGSMRKNTPNRSPAKHRAM